MKRCMAGPSVNWILSTTTWTLLVSQETCKKQDDMACIMEFLMSRTQQTHS
ncbi:hypothetical protein OESDEN_18778 [Oesophagostomum dentatum]|uniref:Uncharacterized protein n=1 Tax=Oesophagostomum dentatum TaxID=61180 RepID=A0A0B1SCC3_OESDE|nr:hypothetical protein OESDEN_18778 [Oesophagostomum dentatum]